MVHSPRSVNRPACVGYLPPDLNSKLRFWHAEFLKVPLDFIGEFLAGLLPSVGKLASDIDYVFFQSGNFSYQGTLILFPAF